MHISRKYDDLMWQTVTCDKSFLKFGHNPKITDKVVSSFKQFHKAEVILKIMQSLFY